MVELDPATCEVEVNRIASDETARYILIKNQPSNSGICSDEIMHMVHVEDQVDTDGDKPDTNSDKVDGSGDKVAISDDTVDIECSRMDSKSNTPVNVMDSGSDTPATNGDIPATNGDTPATNGDIPAINGDKGVMNISKDNIDTKNKIESNITSHDNRNINTSDATNDAVICIIDGNDEKSSNRREHAKSKVDITIGTVGDAVICEVDSNGDKVDINSDTVEVPSNKVDMTEYNDKAITDDTMDTALTATDDQLDIHCDKTDTYHNKVDTQCDKVTVTDKKFDIDVEIVDITVNKGDDTSHSTTKQMTSEVSDIRALGINNTCYSIHTSTQL